jgi:hypothetical protein
MLDSVWSLSSTSLPKAYLRVSEMVARQRVATNESTLGKLEELWWGME